MTASTSRTARHRRDRRKAHGVHYTPPELAAFLAEEGIAVLGEAPGRVLDPACGGGELLAAVAGASRSSDRSRMELAGFDTDAAALEHARTLCEPYGAKALVLERADFLDLGPSRLAAPSLFDAGLEPDAPPAFDLAIANPPYVRTQTLGSDRVAKIVGDFALTGRVDLYQAFAFAMTDHLRPGGVLALLCPNRFLITRAGESLRELLRARYHVDRIIDLGDTRLFEAAVLPAVVIATKTAAKEEDRSGPTCFVSVYEDRRKGQARPEQVATSPISALRGGLTGAVAVSERSYVVRRGQLRPVASVREPWTLCDDATNDFLTRVSSRTAVTFRDVAKIRVGVKTTADRVFIRRTQDWLSVPEGTRPETELLRPLLSNDQMRRWRASEPERLILYPHVQSGNRCLPVDLGDYPAAAAYLEGHRGQLEGREYVRAAGRRWFEIWVPQKPAEFLRPKVVFPDIAEDARFCFDTTGAVVNGNCYWMAIDDEALAMLVLAVGNSGLTRRFYDAVCGNVLYAGRRRFMTQYVERFPLPDPDSSLARAIVASARKLVEADEVTVDDEAEIDDLVARSFGLEEVPG